jgi:lytic murein transglycosylase
MVSVVRHFSFVIAAGVIASTVIGAATHAALATTTPDIAACLASLRLSARAHGVSLGDFDRWTQGATLLPSTVSAARRQPEGREPYWDYIAKMVDDERVEQGRAIQKQYADTLARVGEDYRVDGEALVAIFGIETNYGTQLGKTRVLDAWLTRACTESNPLWKKNVYAAIRLLVEGTVQPEQFVGSWSGAFGMTQFIPTSFYELAADADGDGRIDLYGSLPDALASTANHLLKRRAKWTLGLPAVIEVRLPDDLKRQLPDSTEFEFAATQDRRTIAAWREAGVLRADGQALAVDPPAVEQDLTAYVFAPTGGQGPVFLATPNFDAILQYNQSKRYALAVALLLERLQGHAGLRTPWPTDDLGLARVEVRELQTLLAARGHDVGPADGILGAHTRDAVRVEQQRAGLTPDGRVGQRTLQTLRKVQ